MHKREVHTTNEFAYDVLNNIIHYNEILVPKQELKNSRAIKSIVSRFHDSLRLEDRKDHYLIRRTKPLNILIIFRKK